MIATVIVCDSVCVCSVKLLSDSVLCAARERRATGTSATGGMTISPSYLLIYPHLNASYFLKSTGRDGRFFS